MAPAFEVEKVKTMTQTEINQAHFLKFPKEFDVEMDQVEATVINHDISRNRFYVNVLQSPGHVVGMGIGNSISEAAERAIAISDALNTCGL